MADEVTVAAAMLNAGVDAFRTSVGGEPRGPVCGMGVCYECRVTIDGVAHRRACMEPCTSMSGPTPSMSGPTAPMSELSAVALRPQPDPQSTHTTTRASTSHGDPVVSWGLSATALSSDIGVGTFDIAVIGAGPAGVAAACVAAESGARVVLVDDGRAPGGQIWRHRPAIVPAAARAWLERLARSGATSRFGATVFDADRHGDSWLLQIEDAQPVVARRVIIATGARELLLPFPGWTLPNVFSAGGLQALVKSGFDVSGKTVAIAGSGPLLLPVAATLARAGARVSVVAEAAPLGPLVRFSRALLGSPGKLFEAAKYRLAFRGAAYRTGTWVVDATGVDRVESVTLNDGRRIACDLAAVSYGLVPNTDLAELLGCETDRNGVRVDERQRTSIPGVFAAGEPCGVAGVDVALAEGVIAGLAAATDGDFEIPKALVRARSGGRRIARAMADAFRVRADLLTLARPDTIVCRCEDVRHSRFDPRWTSRQAKLATRAGMGACQGRVCGPALAELFGYSAQSVRMPLKPASLGALSSLEDEQWSGTEYSPQ